MDKKTQDAGAELVVRNFYDQVGWNVDDGGVSEDARRWEDLRPSAADYVIGCRKRIKNFLPKSGNLFLDAGSGPIQYPEYLEYSQGFQKRVCVDISSAALEIAAKRIREHGECVRASILDLPFPDNHFDSVVSMHAIYHIDQRQQEKAVRSLIRVVKRGQPVVIVYANPYRPLNWLNLIKNSLKRSSKGDSQSGSSELYYFAHPLSWWRRFSDQATVKITPWRSLAVEDSRRFIRGRFAKQLFRIVFWFEERFPRLMTRLGTYPIIVLTKKS